MTPKGIASKLENQEFYSALVEDCQAIITETVFNSRFDLIEGYHKLGKRIIKDFKNFERANIYGDRVAITIGKSLGRSRQTINYAIQFAKEYPKLDALPEGKNISWHKIITRYLPGRKEEGGCKHEYKRETYWRCVHCGKKLFSNPKGR